MRIITSRIIVLCLMFLACAFQLYAKDKNTPILTEKKIRNARLFVQGNLAKNLGEFKQAELIYLECLKYDPQDAAAMYELATIYNAAGNNQAALSYAQKAVNNDTSNDYYKLLLASIYQDFGNYPKSIEVLKELVKSNPDNNNYLRQLAYTYVLTKEYQNAIDLLDQLEKKTGVNELISLQKQQLYITLNQPLDAINELEKLILEFPTEVKYYSIIAELYSRYNYDEKALGAYKKILEISPQDDYIHISLFDYYRKKNQKDSAYRELKIAFENPNLNAETKFQLMFSFYTTEEIYSDENDDPKSLISIIEQTHPDNLRAKGLKADLYYRSGELKKAKAILDSVISLGNTDYPWYELLLIVESDLRNVKEMTELGEKIISMYPQKPLPYLLAGIGKHQMMEIQEAKEILLKGIPFSKDNQPLLIQFYSSLGDVYNELGDTEASDNAYEEALAMDSLNPIVLNNYAYYLALRGEKLDKADQMSKLAVELNPESSSNVDTRAWVLYRLEKYEEALEIIKKAYELDEKNPEIAEHYGDILYKNEEKKKAIKYWKKAKDLGSESTKLEQKIRQKELIE